MRYFKHKNIAKRLARGKAIFLAVGFFHFLGSAFMNAGFEKQRQWGRAAALSFAVTALPGDVWALYSNPALAAEARQGGGVYFAPSPFGLSALAQGGAVYNHPLSALNLSAGLNSFGNGLYHEISASAACAGRPAEGLMLGAVLNYHQLAIVGYGNSGVLGLDVGAAARVGESVMIGAAAFHVNQPRFGRTLKERLPIVLAVGASCVLDSAVILAADIRRDARSQFCLRVGLEWRALAFLALRVGTGSDPESFSAGVGITWRGAAFHYAAALHPDLGMTHTISLTANISSVAELP
jgi:hypothetical protein